MKKWIAFSMASAMLLTMSTAAFADIATGVVSEEKPGWPNEFGFGGQIKVMREEEVLSYDLEENNKIDLQPGDDLYIPLYYTTAEGESVTIGASKEEMTGHVPYTGSIDKNWKINFIDKSKTIIESTDFYRAESKDSGLVKGALYIKAQTADNYNSLTDLEFNFGVYVSERYSQNKTEQIQIEGVFANPKADNLVDFDWENNVYEKAVWEVAEDQDGTATFNFNDDAYFTVRMFGGDKVMLDFDRTYDKVIADRYIEDLYFYNFRGELDEFSATGTLTIPVEQEMFMYQIVNGALKATDAVYSEENEAMELKTRTLGNYVLTPTKLDISAEVETETPSTDVDNNGGSTSQPAPGYGENSETNDYLSGGSDKVNPETGADDLVGLMASLAVLSLVGGVALSRKRK
mgnify:FL=1